MPRQEPTLPPEKPSPVAGIVSLAGVVTTFIVCCGGCPSQPSFVSTLPDAKPTLVAQGPRVLPASDDGIPPVAPGLDVVAKPATSAAKADAGAGPREPVSTPAGRDYLRSRLAELDGFKDTPSFRRNGFGSGAPYRWMIDLGMRQGQAGAYTRRERTAMGDMMLLGLEYASLNGGENNYTRFSRRAIQACIDGGRDASLEEEVDWREFVNPKAERDARAKEAEAATPRDDKPTPTGRRQPSAPRPVRPPADYTPLALWREGGSMPGSVARTCGQARVEKRGGRYVVAFLSGSGRRMVFASVLAADAKPLADHDGILPAMLTIAIEGEVVGAEGGTVTLKDAKVTRAELKD